jgi:hypothetical protein
MNVVAPLTAVVLSLVLSATAFAQGKSQQDHGNGATAGAGKNSGGKAGGSQSVNPPSQTTLAAPASVSAATSPATPFAWVDNANLVAPGAVWIGISAARWHNGAVSELSFPVVDAAVGMTRRVQLGASVPRIMPQADLVGSTGGLGTTFFNAKIGVLNDSERALKLAVSPTLEILGQSTMQWMPAGQNRLQWGLPISAEFDRGLSRIYGSTGYFSPGVWYTGGGVGTQLSARVGVAVTLSHAWSSTDTTDAAPSRNDVSAGVSVDLTQNIGLFGSLGRTLNTAPQYGAGTTASIGISLSAQKISVKE